MTGAISATTLDDLRRTARQLYGYASPYRVGFLAARYHVSIPCPYAPGSRAANCWAKGAEWASASPLHGAA